MCKYSQVRLKLNKYWIAVVLIWNNNNYLSLLFFEKSTKHISTNIFI